MPYRIRALLRIVCTVSALSLPVLAVAAETDPVAAGEPVAQLPAAVQMAAERIARGGPVEDLRRLVREHRVLYQMRITPPSGERSRAVVFAEDGALVSSSPVLAPAMAPTDGTPRADGKDAAPTTRQGRDSGNGP